jgi:hypothetical protein
MISRIKASSQAATVQRRWGHMPTADSYLKPQLQPVAINGSMPSNWMPLSHQSTLFFSDKNDKDENKTPKGFEKFFKKK